jgi:hypothetical protein
MSNDTLALSLAAHATPLGRVGPAQAIARPVSNGPGWFASSFDLHRGLEVREGWPGDARLRSWIESFLGAQA